MAENSEDMQQYYENIVKQELAKMINVAEEILDINSEDTFYGPSSSSITALFPSAPPFMPSDEDDSDDDDALKIVYESLNSVPELNVEVNERSKEIIIDFLKKDLSPYHGCYSSRCKLQRRDLGLCVVFNIGGQPLNKEKNEEPPVKSTPPPPSRRPALHCGICRESHVQIFKSGRSLMSSVCGHIFCNICVDRCEESHKKCLTCDKKLTKKQYHFLYQ